MVADQRGCPTHAGDLATAIAKVLTTDLRGIAHAAGGGECTWYGFAQAIVSCMGVPVTIQPIATADAKRAADRPAYGVLANHVLAKAGITLPHWEDALKRFMQDEKAKV